MIRHFTSVGCFVDACRLARAERRPSGRAMPTNLPRETGWKPYNGKVKPVTMEKLVLLRRGI